MSNGGNTFTAGNPNGLTSPFGTWAPFSTLMATATSGTPLGGNTLFFYDGTTAIAPATTSPPSDIMLGTAAGKNLQLFSGGTLLLNKGGNTSLTFTANAFAVTLSSNSSGTLVVVPASGIANLGLLSATTGTPVGEALVVTLAPTAINNMVQPTIVGQASATDTTGDFVTYYVPGTVVGTNTYSGLRRYRRPTRVWVSRATRPIARPAAISAAIQRVPRSPASRPTPRPMPARSFRPCG